MCLDEFVAPSMFGRDLVEQVRADAKHDPGRMVPLIVDKCIRAVEASGEQPRSRARPR